MPDASAQHPCVVFGAALRTERERRGMTQAQLADASGLHRRTIAQIERGLSNLRFSTLMALSDGLGSLADVFAMSEGREER